MDELDNGIFLFKSSKSRVSTDSLFTEPAETKTEPLIPLVSSYKWMKQFLLKYTNPSLLPSTNTLTPVTSEQLLVESCQKFAEEKDLVVDISVPNIRKLTRANRRHKIKTRRQRTSKTKIKNMSKNKNKIRA